MCKLCVCAYKIREFCYLIYSKETFFFFFFGSSSSVNLTLFFSFSLLFGFQAASSFSIRFCSFSSSLAAFFTCFAKAFFFAFWLFLNVFSS
ncbi:hypothetical protein BD770DRAFT_183983 [Pilaira anomala]|nr:hypothetical protein BD770DRAFT_183983 [Pilaira anomala]